MKLPKEGILMDLQKKDLIESLYRSFVKDRSQKKIKCWYFATLWQFSQKMSDNFSLSFFCIQLLGDDINQLSRDGFDSIIQKVIVKVVNVRFGLFSNKYRYYSVVTKCCPILLHHVAS